MENMDFWHLQSKEDIYNAVKTWDLYKFICLMKDGTIQKFTGIMDEDYDGHISVHIDCIDENYEWEYDDIIYWIENE